MRATPVYVEFKEPRMIPCFEDLLCLFHVSELNGASNNLQQRIVACRHSVANPEYSIDVLVTSLTDQDYAALESLPFVRKAHSFPPGPGTWTKIEILRQRLIDGLNIV